MEDFATAANIALAEARQKATALTSPKFRRMEEDVLIQIGLGDLIAAKLRSAALFEIFQQAARYESLHACICPIPARPPGLGNDGSPGLDGVYLADIAYGRTPMRRGHWSDRLGGIDKDIEALATKLERAKLKPTPAAAKGGASAETVARAIQAVMGRPNRDSGEV